MSTGSGLGLLSPFTVFLLHLTAYRLVPRLRDLPRQSFVVLLILLTVILISAVAWTLTGTAEESIHAGILSLLYGYIYFHWFNMSETARRIRMLVTYVTQGKMPGGQAGYDSQSMLRNRIQRMLETKIIEKRGEKYLLKSPLLLGATRVILFWRGLFFR